MAKMKSSAPATRPTSKPLQGGQKAEPKKMAKGGAVCRGMGAASRGGSYKAD
jgi:hypothetical protein